MLTPPTARLPRPHWLTRPPHAGRTLQRVMTRIRKSEVQRTGPTAPSRRSVRDRCVIERYVALPAERAVAPVQFHLVPENGWNDHTRQLRCGMNNVIEWDGELPLPAAPSSPCWRARPRPRPVFGRGCSVIILFNLLFIRLFYIQTIMRSE